VGWGTFFPKQDVFAKSRRPGSAPGHGDRESFASALALWIRDTIVPAVRKEALNESKKEAQEAVRVVQTEMESEVCKQ
jgi:hypothetical protein